MAREALLHGGYAIAHPAVAFRRSEALEFGGYTLGAEGFEDLDLWLRMLASGDLQYVSSPAPVLFYRVHRGQASARLDRAREVGLRISREASALAPCCTGCPGRLASFHHEVSGRIAEACPTRRHEFGSRVILSQVKRNPRFGLPALGAVLEQRAYASASGAIEAVKEKEWLALL